jgi:hypothetical protein
MAAQKGHGVALRGRYVGVLLHSNGRADVDDGRLDHPARAAHKPLLSVSLD